MHVHCIGIGGIGVSALAKYYQAHGAKVTGSDLSSSEITEELERMGIPVAIGKHKKNNIGKGITLVITTSATPKDNPELLEAKKKKIKTQTYPEALGEITKQYSTVTVSGSHGKSTTTAMTALVMEDGYCDPTVIIGTKLREFGDSNFRKGYSRYLLLEADEWNKSFLNYSPTVAAITNIDAEHLDTYKSLIGVMKAFDEYMSKVPKDGAIVANKDDKTLRKVAKKFGKLVHWYSLEGPDTERVKKILKVHGTHNLSNALAALTIGRVLGIRESDSIGALSRFTGTWRRFEFKGKINGGFLFTDYAHHPKEIQATIQGARAQFPFRRIWCVYQPHQYQRLAFLWDDFIGAFDMADTVSLVPVYDVAGRETASARKKVSSEALTHELQKRGKNASHHDSFEEMDKHIRALARPGDVIIVMGAGDIYSRLLPGLVGI